MSKVHQLKSYIKYLQATEAKSYREYPILSDFVSKVLYDETKYDEYKILDEERNNLIKDNSRIEVVDFGAHKKGNKPYITEFRKISNIAKNAASQPKISRLIYRIIKHYNAHDIIELGTSLGIGTSHMALANPNANITSIEGCHNLVTHAQELLAKLNMNNITFENGNIDNLLPQVLKQRKKVDFVYFDGNHKKDATLNYFNQCLKLAHKETIFMFDDIYWSKDMTRAWNEIINNKQVSGSIDLYYSGIVFFNHDMNRINLSLKL